MKLKLYQNNVDRISKSLTTTTKSVQPEECAIQEQALCSLLGTPGTELTLLKLTISFQVTKKNH
jgi:hypothetical protein